MRAWGREAHLQAHALARHEEHGVLPAQIKDIAEGCSQAAQDLELQPVPVDDALLGQIVVEMNADLLPAAYPDGGLQIGIRHRLQGLGWALYQLALEGPYLGRCARQNALFGRCRPQTQLDIGVERIAAGRPCGVRSGAR